MTNRRIVRQNRQFQGVWIPSEAWLNPELSIAEACLLTEIQSLDVNQQGCFASNKYFADFFGKSPSRISQMITSLQNKGYLTVEYDREEQTQQVTQRRIHFISFTPLEKTEGGFNKLKTPFKKLKGGYLKNETPPLENAKDNNTTNNTCVNKTNNIGAAPRKTGGQKEQASSPSRTSQAPHTQPAFAEKKARSKSPQQEKQLVPEKLINDVYSYLNGTTGKNYTPQTDNYGKSLLAHWYQVGYRYDDFCVAIDNQTAKWLGNHHQFSDGLTAEDHLRPATLFGKNFERYFSPGGKPDLTHSYDEREQQHDPDEIIGYTPTGTPLHRPLPIAPENQLPW